MKTALFQVNELIMGKTRKFQVFLKFMSKMIWYLTRRIFRRIIFSREHENSINLSLKIRPQMEKDQIRNIFFDQAYQ